jgi:hypothetical protein
MKNLLHNLLGINTDAEKVFFDNEYRALAWRTQGTFWWLLLIIFVMLMALGFAFGSWQNLEKRMRNPYTNWVSHAIDKDLVRNQVPNMQLATQNDSVRETFHLNDMTVYDEYWFDACHSDFNPYQSPSDTLVFRFAGRTVQSDEAILKAILDPASDNVIVSYLAPEEPYTLEGCGVIVEAGLLQTLGYTDFQTITHLPLMRDSLLVLAKIEAIVKDLPTQYNFISTTRFSNIWNNFQGDITHERFSCGQLLICNQDTGSVFQCLVPDENAAMVETAARKAFGENMADFDRDAKKEYPNRSAALYRITFKEGENLPSDAWKNFLLNSRAKGIPVSDFAEISCPQRCNQVRLPDYIAFNFNDLDRIREFRNYLLDNFGVELNMDQVEAKDNFAQVTWLTIVVCTVLLCLGIFCVMLYVNSLLESHLQEVKPNLGTFQAFGLSERFLSSLYRKIILTFLLFTSLGALGFSIIIDRMEQWLNAPNSYFNIFSWVIPGALVGILIFSLAWTWLTIKRTLKETPGDLIYGR